MKWQRQSLVKYILAAIAACAIAIAVLKWSSIQELIATIRFSGDACDAVYGDIRFYGSYGPNAWEYCGAEIPLDHSRVIKVECEYLGLPPVVIDQDIDKNKQLTWTRLEVDPWLTELISGYGTIEITRQGRCMKIIAGRQLIVDEHRFTFPVAKAEIDAVLGPPSTFKSRSTYR